jgi:hypothetical protein
MATLEDRVKNTPATYALSLPPPQSRVLTPLPSTCPPPSLNSLHRTAFPASNRQLSPQDASYSVE